MSRVLLAAPWIGEVGWELMSWQARVRWAFVRGGYDRTVVIGGAGKAAFYDGMNVDYRPMDLGYLQGAAYEDRRLITATGEAVPAERLRQCVAGAVERTLDELRGKGDAVDVVWPEFTGKPLPCDPAHQLFVRYIRKPASIPDRPWVVLVQRTRSFNASRNWPAQHWAELARLLEERGVHTSVYPCEAEAAIAMLSGCDLAIGQTTGGLHLAALCGCPTLAWSTQSYLMWRWEITNRQRFETWWNPFGTPVTFKERRQLPSPEEAASQVMGALRAIGRRTGSLLQRAAFRVKWRMRSSLRRRVIEPGRYARWPWPVQRFVRYQLA